MVMGGFGGGETSDFSNIVLAITTINICVFSRL